MKKLLLWSAFVVYVIVLFFTISHHELWGDEVHSWNIAKGSGSYIDLIHHTRFEGHPPVWYTILWTISKFTHDLAYMQAAQFVLACAVVFVVLFYSPFPVITRILISFGYYTLYEYAALSRNYAAGILFAFCICLIMHRQFRGKTILYYALLLLLTNVHLLALVLGGALHFYFLLLKKEQREKNRSVMLHVLAGAMVFLPALIFIYPPSDSELNMGFWLDKWNIQQLSAFSQAPLRSLLPMPAVWNYQFWNTQFLLTLKGVSPVFRFVNPLVALVVLALCFNVLRKNRKSLVMFSAHLLVTFIIAVVVFPLGSARYAGFIYIGFLAAYWLYCYETPVSRINQRIVNSILAIHVIAGVFAVYKDIRYPFSALHKVTALLKKVPQQDSVVADYWALNAVSAFCDKSFYCIDMQQNKSFIEWGSDLAIVLKKPHRYCDGISALFKQTGLQKVYMVSMGTVAELQNADNLLLTSYEVTLIDKTQEVPIEKGSNLYLYEIKSH
jgi:hypothetical protein